MRRSTRRGMSLVEVVIAIGLFMLMVSGLVALTVTSANAWSSNSSQMMADGSASTAIQLLAQEVRAGLRASINTGGTQLTVIPPRVNAEGDYDRTVEGAPVTYYLSGTNLCRQQGTATKLLARRVTSVSFSVAGTDVTIQLNTRQQVGSRPKDATLTTHVALRNTPL